MQNLPNTQGLRHKRLSWVRKKEGEKGEKNKMRSMRIFIVRFCPSHHFPACPPRSPSLFLQGCLPRTQSPSPTTLRCVKRKTLTPRQLSGPGGQTTSQPSRK